MQSRIDVYKSQQHRAWPAPDHFAEGITGFCILMQQEGVVSQTPDHLKTRTGEEAYNDNGLVQRSIRLLKDTFPDLEVSALSCLLASVCCGLHLSGVQHWSC